MDMCVEMYINTLFESQFGQKSQICCPAITFNLEMFLFALLFSKVHTMLFFLIKRKAKDCAVSYLAYQLM